MSMNNIEKRDRDKLFDWNRWWRICGLFLNASTKWLVWVSEAKMYLNDGLVYRSYWHDWLTPIKEWKQKIRYICMKLRSIVGVNNSETFSAKEHSVIEIFHTWALSCLFVYLIECLAELLLASLSLFVCVCFYILSHFIVYEISIIHTRLRGSIIKCCQN